MSTVIMGRREAAVPANAIIETRRTESAIVGLGLLGLLLSGALALYMWLTGTTLIGREGYLLKAVQFDLALGLFLLNTAVMLPLVGFGPALRRFWRWALFSLGLYAYGVETIQVLRGIDPRFSNQLHSFVEAIPNMLFGIASMLIVLLYVVLVSALFRKRRSDRPLMVLAMRYGVLSTLAAFAGGVYMIAIGGSHVGVAGNALWIHFIGIVGMKALFATGWSAKEQAGGGRWIHLAGISWLLAVAMVGYQTLEGLNPFTLTPQMVACVVMLSAWGMATLRLIRTR